MTASRNPPSSGGQSRREPTTAASHSAPEPDRLSTAVSPALQQAGHAPARAMSSQSQPPAATALAADHATSSQQKEPTEQVGQSCMSQLCILPVLIMPTAGHRGRRPAAPASGPSSRTLCRQMLLASSAPQIRLHEVICSIAAALWTAHLGLQLVRDCIASFPSCWSLYVAKTDGSRVHSLLTCAMSDLLQRAAEPCHS